MQNKTINLTEGIESWDEPKETLQGIKAQLDKYIGHRVFVWGGGGYSGSAAILDGVDIEPTILRNGKGYTLKAHLHEVNPPIDPYTEHPDIWEPWLGSWQISAVV